MHFQDGKSFFRSMFINQPRDSFRGRIGIDDIDWFSQRAKHWQRGVLLAENHAVIEILINPAANFAFDIVKVEQHPPIVELCSLQDNHGTAIMAMQITALSLVIQQAMAVTEFNFLCNAIHEELR